MDQLQERERAGYRLLVFGNGSVRTIPLHGTRWVVGRADDCTITLRDPTVSRRHVLIERAGETFRFRDLGGSNPVLLDGAPRQEGVLEVGQTLLVGLSRLTLERRNQPAQIVAASGATVVLSREVIDEEVQPVASSNNFLTAARRVLERIEWTFADLGDLGDAAEPLLELAINLTARRRGAIARLHPEDGVEILATLDVLGPCEEIRLPDQILREARRLSRPNLVTTQDRDRVVDRLIVPLGAGPDGVLVLEEPLPDAPSGQDLLRLGRTLGRVVWHRLQEAQERLRLRDEVQRLRFHGTASHQALLASTRLHDIRQRARELANTERIVLLLGETGTEREELSRFMHVEGTRAKGPFVTVNLSTLDEHRHADELFGNADSPGAVAAAQGGTLFIDDVDRLTPQLQDRLVQSLTPETGNAASNTTRLLIAAEIGPERAPQKWSPLLTERVALYTLSIPPLRSDARDILALAELFLSDLGPTRDGSPRLLSERTKRILVGHAWPENVRELRSVLEVAAARAGKQPIAPRHLPEHLSEPTAALATPEIPTLEQVEAEHIREVLQRVGGNRAKAAQMLGIAASTLYEKLKRYSIEE